jgi:hypothetical protein
LGHRAQEYAAFGCQNWLSTSWLVALIMIAEMTQGFDTAQICENGHVNTSSLDLLPEYDAKFCQKCGAATLTSCRSCDTPIRGHSKDSFAIRYDVPSYCQGCGKPYPWTATAMAEWRALAEMAEVVDSERKQLSEAIDDVVKDSPKTNRAVLIIKRLGPKAGADLWNAMQQLLISVGTAAAKKELGL